MKKLIFGIIIIIMIMNMYGLHIVITMNERNERMESDIQRIINEIEDKEIEVSENILL